MKPIAKWSSIIGVTIAMLLLLYYTGVVNSAVSFGVAIGIIAVSVILFVMFTKAPKD
jgi:hypothetical protein